MKPHRRILAFAFLLAAVVAPTHFANARDLVVLDFTDMPRNTDGSRQRTYEYGWDDWGDAGKKVGQLFGKGLIVNLAGSKGGIGSNSDLGITKQTRLRFDLMIGDRNQAESFIFSLVDSDGTDQSWDIPLKDQPVGKPIAVILDLTKPAREDKPGRKPGLNLKKIATWQIKGNYQDKPVEMLLMKVSALSE